MPEKILVGLDDSEESWKAFDYAINEAKKKELAGITAVHSEHEIETSDERRKSDEILEEAERIGNREGVEVETHLISRDYEPDVDIIKFAEKNEYNHIIVGHRGRTGLSRVLLGSVAEGIVEKAHCAVTVVRDVCPT